MKGDRCVLDGELCEEAGGGQAFLRGGCDDDDDDDDDDDSFQHVMCVQTANLINKRPRVIRFERAEDYTCCRTSDADANL